MAQSTRTSAPISRATCAFAALVGLGLLLCAVGVVLGLSTGVENADGWAYVLVVAPPVSAAAAAFRLAFTRAAWTRRSQLSFVGIVALLVPYAFGALALTQPDGRVDGPNGGAVVAMDAETGRLRWETDVAGLSVVVRADLDGGRLNVIGTEAAGVCFGGLMRLQLNKQDGAVVGRDRFGGAGGPPPPPGAFPNRSVPTQSGAVLATDAGLTYLLNRVKSGWVVQAYRTSRKTAVWSQPIPDPYHLLSRHDPFATALVDGGVLYVAAAASGDRCPSNG